MDSCRYKITRRIINRNQISIILDELGNNNFTNFSVYNQINRDQTHKHQEIRKKTVTYYLRFICFSDVIHQICLLTFNKTSVKWSKNCWKQENLCDLKKKYFVQLSINLRSFVVILSLIHYYFCFFSCIDY